MPWVALIWIKSQAGIAGTVSLHVVVFGERHPRHVLSCYMDYSNATRTHLSATASRGDKRLTVSSTRSIQPTKWPSTESQVKALRDFGWELCEAVGAFQPTAYPETRAW